MPVVKLKHIVSFSSEDKVHKAENLLQESPNNKWRCASPGESQASVVIQLEKASFFSGIDIGNDGSAFVEVLVSRSTGEELYKVLLVASSFMSLTESRSGDGANRVRMFDSTKLCQDVMNEKWDRVKVVCTQPFNKHSAYGLRFINFHSPEEKDNPAGTVSKSTQSTSTELSSGDQPRTTFGAFKLKADVSDKPASVPSIFKKSSALSRADPPIDIEKLKRKAAENARSPSDKKSKQDNEKDKLSGVGQDQEKPATSGSSRIKQIAVPSKNITAPKKIETAKSLREKKKDISNLLRDVVFALSGYQNPERGEIRDKALLMGAQYRRDWTQDCTHLICAFANTPKYHQVVGTEGRIILAGWINDCYDLRKRLPIKPYNLRPDYTSDDEVKLGVAFEPYAIVDSISPLIARAEQPQPNNTKKIVTPSVHKPPHDVHCVSVEIRNAQENKSDDDFNPYDESTDEESPDTEDELQRIFKKKQQGIPTSPPVGDRDVYDESTDEETEEENTDSELKNLPEYFNGLEFFLYGRFEPEIERLLKRHILTCDGSISNYMNDDVKYVITESSWHQDFDDALGDNPNLVFVKPLWVFRCGQEKKLLPHHPFILSSK